MKFLDEIPQPEFAGDDEFLARQKLPETALRASYQERVHQFRSDVVQLMMKHTALQEAGSWLIFEHIEEMQESAVLLAPRTDICVTSKTVPDISGRNIYGNQNIRIMLNEAFSSDKGTEHFVIDATVSPLGNSQYNVGVMPADPVKNGEGVTVPVFFVANNVLGLYSPNRPTAFSEIQYINETTIPFGHYTNIEDRFHALNVAYGLLNAVLDREPLHSSQTH